MGSAEGCRALAQPIREEHPVQMTLQAVPIPESPAGRWTWESARAHTRAIRISPRTKQRVVNISLWRDDRCVGSVHLSPAEAASVAAKLSQALADLAIDLAPEAGEEPDLESRVSTLEARLAE